MFCMKGKISVLRRGIAAFLMLTLVVGNVAYLGGTVFAVETTDEMENPENGILVLFAQEESEAGSEASTTGEEAVKLAANETAATPATETAAAPTSNETKTAPATEAKAAPTTEAKAVPTNEAATEGTTETLTTEGTSGTPTTGEKETATNDAFTKASATEPVLSTYVPQDQSVGFGYTGQLKYENYHTQNFFVTSNGTKIRAYCIEPTVRWKYKKSYTAKPYDDKLMKKALYYSIGYPGYASVTAGYLAGVSRKACYKGDNGVYCLCHIVLSYIYDNKNSKSDAFKGVSSGTKKVVKNFLSAIETWPDPPAAADIGLSASSIKAGWNEDTMRQETPTVEVTGTPGNTISVPVPEGTTIVKGGATADAGNVATANTGSVTVAVGESFSLTAPATVQTDYVSPSLYGSMEVFQPYILKTPDSQGQTFGISARNAVSYKIDWNEFGTIELKKVSSDEETTNGNKYYSLEGAEYGLYSKASDTLYGKLVTNSEGTATIGNIPYGQFYLKELKAPQGYKMDSSEHEIAISSPQQTETLLEEPSKPDLETSAVEEGTGEKSIYVKDNEEGVDTSIVDTVKYKNLTPGLEYRIEARLADKASGQEIPSQVAQTIFTPEKSSGSLLIEYGIDSSTLGGKSAVAFEKLYQGDNLIAVHEDVNNKAQTVNILKPVDSAPETGDNLNIVLWVFALVVSLVIGGLIFMRRC